MSQQQYLARSQDEIARFFNGLDLVAPCCSGQYVSMQSRGKRIAEIF